MRSGSALFVTTLQTATRQPVRSALLTFFGMWLALAVLTIGWAIATPLSASPDEPAHIIRAASVVRGELIGAPTDQPPNRRVLVPESLADSGEWPCFAFKPSVSASCMKPFRTGLQLAPAKTSAGLYDPVYYLLVGWPSLFIANGQAAGLAMRIVSALLCTALASLAFLVMTRMRSAHIIRPTFLIAITPVVVFLSSVVNPNALEICAGLAYFAIALYIVRDVVGPPSWWALSGLMVSGVLLANARSLSPFWLAIFGAAALVYAAPERLRDLAKMRRFQIAFLVIVVGSIFSVVWTMTTGSLVELGKFTGVGSASPVKTFFDMLLGSTVDIGWIGVFGWLDTVAPTALLTIWFVLFFGLTIGAFMIARRRALIALVIAAAALFIVPAGLQAASIRNSGYIWQGRYALVAFVCLTLMAAVILADRVHASWAPRRPAVIVACLTTLCQVWAFATALARYTVGVVDARALLRPAAWEPPGGIAFVVVLASIGALGVALIVLFAPGPRPSPTPRGEAEYAVVGSSA